MYATQTIIIQGELGKFAAHKVPFGYQNLLMKCTAIYTIQPEIIVNLESIDAVWDNSMVRIFSLYSGEIGK